MATPAFPLPDRISQSSTRHPKQRVLKAQYGDGYSQTVADGTNSMYDEWSLTLENLTKAEFDIFQAWYLTVGCTVRWTWKPFNSATTKTWKFVSDTYGESYPSGNTTTITITASQEF